MATDRSHSFRGLTHSPCTAPCTLEQLASLVDGEHEQGDGGEGNSSANPNTVDAKLVGSNDLVELVDPLKSLHGERWGANLPANSKL